MPRPDRADAAESYFTYIDQVGDDDVLEVLRGQLTEIAALHDISEERSLYRYAPDKWSIRQLLGHVNDTERVFVFRALWFARGLESPLPGFDQKIAAAAALADERSWASQLGEFRSIRTATLAFFQDLSSDAWARRGVASGHLVTVNALAYITAGHVAHHLRVLRQRYM
jgi:hypothetical protein